MVQRLRLVFALIVSVIGVAVLLALFQFKSLEEAQSNLLRTSVPVLIRTQVFEHALYDLAILLGKIEAAPNQNELRPIAQKVEEQFTRTKQNIAGLNGVQEDSQQVDLILDQLAEIETGIQANLLMKRIQFQTAEQLDRQLDRLAQTRFNVRGLVEQLSFDATQSMDLAVMKMFETGYDGPEAWILRLGEETRHVSLTSKLALELETIANVVAQLGNQISSDKLNKTRDFLAFRLRGVLQLLLHLPPSDNRLDLSVQINDMRETIFSDRGILKLIEENSEISRDLAVQSAVEKIVVGDITAATERLVVSAHGHFLEAGKVTQLTTRQLILILSVAAISVAIIVVVAILVIVERQINRRLALLTNSVLRIASGDTEHVTQVSGTDELGRMAEALGTFKRNACKLIRSNAELEKFAYAAAHDLRSPLQSIHDLAKWTAEDEANVLSEDSAINLRLLGQRVDRLSSLLNDLLQYARVGVDMPKAVAVDLDALIHETATIVDPSSSFEITHNWDGSIIDTYMYPLQKIFLSLIGNTVKHHERQQGKIEINSVIRDGRLWIEYSDDGVGIAPEYHEKIFELFQRLQTRDDLEGSGLGLAITKKLVEYFEGKVTVSSNPSLVKGTTFTFDFPASHVHDVDMAA